MRLIYFGTGTFSIPALRAMADSIALVVTQPDRPSGRGMKLMPSPAKLVAIELGIEVAAPEKSRAPEFVDRLEAMKPDALLVASYGQILSQRLLDSAVRGGINLHGSLLPKWRGAAPIQRAIQHREQVTGITLMQMDKGMDTGDIIATERTEIGPDETYGELQDRLAIIAAQMAVEWMPRIGTGDYPRTSQDDSRKTIAPKIEKSETFLQFEWPIGIAYAALRAFTPGPGACLATKFGILKVHSARLGTNFGLPGVVTSVAAGCEVAFGGGTLNLHEVQLEGKKRVMGRDFANGIRLKPGMSLI